MEAWHRWIQKDLKELWDWFVDAWIDAAATLVPFVPAWGSKVVRWISNLDIKWVKKLDRHFKDHGADFGSINKNDYYNQASNFMWWKKWDWVLEKVNKHGDSIIRYNPKTNTFWSINKENWVIRTFFKPEWNWKKYFDNQ